MSDDTSDENTTKNRPPTVLGWAARFLSLGILLALVGLIFFQVVSEDKEVQFTTTVVADEIRQQNGQYLIPLDIKNEGSRAVNSVDLEVSVAGQPTEIEIGMIGAHETVRFVVSSDQRTDEVSHRIISYTTP